MFQVLIVTLHLDKNDVCTVMAITFWKVLWQITIFVLIAAHKRLHHILKLIILWCRQFLCIRTLFNFKNLLEDIRSWILAVHDIRWPRNEYEQGLTCHFMWKFWGCQLHHTWANCPRQASKALICDTIKGNESHEGTFQFWFVYIWLLVHFEYFIVIETLPQLHI